MTRPLSPARAHYERAAAEQRTAAETPEQQQNANAYELMLMKLAEDKRALHAVQSIERKAETKRAMLPTYTPWVEGVLAGNQGVQDDVLMTVMVWSIDVGDLTTALRIGRYAVAHKLSLPDQYKRTTGCLLAEEFADHGLKLLTDPAPDLDKPLLMSALMEAGVITGAEDMPDEVRAKLHKAIGYAARACATDSTGHLADSIVAESALHHLRKALTLHAKVGVKRDIELLERALKAAPPNSAPALGETSDAG